MNAKTIAENAKKTAEALAQAGTEAKNAALRSMATRLQERKQDILAANGADMKDAQDKGLEPNLVNRLRFGEAKIDGRVRCLGKIEALPDPVGQVFRSDLRPNGLQFMRVREPLGVILMIFEARPHVTVNAGAFCLKSGNAAILRGGSEAKRCNTLLGDLWGEALREAGLPETAVQVVTGSHEEIQELLQRSDCIDLVIPRGGKKLIEAVHRNSAIPVVKHFEGICHVYVDEGADREKALRIILDSKLLMPEVCNASETVLLHQANRDWIKPLVAELAARGVETRGCPVVLEEAPEAKPATDEDWATEYLDTIYSIRVVEDLSAAIAHLRQYGSGHTDSIVTEDYARARRFVREAPSSVALVNASTMFCDGETMGMGAEIGISTDKLHARGPMGLEELTTYKHVVFGDGQVMGEPHDWKR